VEFAATARKHVRALALAADPLDAFRWAAATFEDCSLEVQHAGSITDALTLLDGQPFDLAIVAAALGDASYRDVLRALHAADEALPAVVVGALDGDGIRDALALGAADVVAPSDVHRLGPALLRTLRETMLASALQRARAEATLVDQALRRTRDEVAVVALDGERPVTVYATRPDLAGRALTDLPFVRDAEEAEELAAAVGALRSSRLRLAAGTVAIEPLAAPPYDRRYVALSLNRDAATPDDRDPVTGLPQRGSFERRAHSALADAERDGTSLGVLFVDVDRFRSVNELGDHTAGDAVLREIAARLRDALPDAYVTRFGGDEFVLLCEEREPGAVCAAAETALAAVAKPFIVSGKPVRLTASVGIATAPDDAHDVAALVGQAETAVFEAKRCGRNTVRWYRAATTSSVLDRMMLRHDLHHAIERDELELYYQPMYDVDTRAIHAVEALVRWRHPSLGMLAPDRFIPLAEECGMIETLGAWVLDRALAQLRAWSDEGIPAVRVSVNVSARQLEGDALPRHVAALLARHRVAASALEIEITESSIMRDVAAAARLLRDLREIGVRVSIDDFGTGYTSLGFLKRFPVDVLKIDKSFVADVADGAFDNAVIRAVTTLARALGVRTVAEGVEAQDQFDRLRALDCDVVQGFLFCRPLSVADCTPLLAART